MSLSTEVSMPTHHRPMSIVSTCLAIASALLVTGCGKPSAAITAAPPPTVAVAKPLMREITDYDEFPGRISAVESASVRARVPGYLAKVGFVEGQLVKQGQVLFMLDREPLQAEEERLSAEVRRSGSALELARSNAERGRRLVETDAISHEESETLDNTRDQAAASLAVARATLHLATLNLAYTEVRAPITGRVGRALVTAGNLVSGGTADGTVLTTIVSLDPVYVLFDTDENAYLRYLKLAREGARLSGRDDPKRLTLALADETVFAHEGTLDFVDNKLDTATGTLRARGVFKNTSGTALLPGMFARVRLPGTGAYQALLIEDRAVGTDLGRRVVLTVDAKGVVRPKPVLTGPLYGGLRVIRSGLAADDWVIVDGLQRARAGAAVTPNRGVMQAPVIAIAIPTSDAP